MNKPRIGIIISSVRPTRVGPQIADWILQSAPADANAEIIDLAAENLPLFMDQEMPGKGKYDQPSTLAWAEKIASYGGFIVALAEYNGAYTAALKNAIDTLGPQWRGKPIGLVSYGAYGGTRAVTAMEPVLSTIGAKQLVGPALRFEDEVGYSRQMEQAEAGLDQLWSQVLAEAATV